MLEHDLIPYSATQSIGRGAALVLAPHPDDEVFACAGAILCHAAQGDPVTIVLLTDGAAQGKSPEDRLQESRKAANILGVATPICWHLPDRGVDYSEGLITRISDIVTSQDAKLIYAPWPGELHPDHRAIALAALEAVRRLGGDRLLVQYEISAPMRPNRLLDITQHAATKVAAMRVFQSQLAYAAYDDFVVALNRYRAYTLPAEVQAAEGYFVCAASDLQRTPNLASHTGDARLFNTGQQARISVLIRSANRPTLQAALDSVDAQTYAQLDIVIANSTGKPHADIAPGRFPRRLIDTGIALSRAQAANALLDAATGDWLIFLDDDDWFDADHLSKLIAANLSSAALASYTGVRCVDLDGNPLDARFDSAFDADRLLVANFLPIHAVLFHRSLLAKGCRFDEQFSIYEDWDFWLQVAQFGPLQQVAGLSAVYRLNPSGGSGVHQDDNRREGMRRLFAKWIAPDHARFAAASAARFVDYDTQLTHAHKSSNALLAAMQKQQQTAEAAQQHAADMARQQLQQKENQLLAAEQAFNTLQSEHTALNQTLSDVQLRLEQHVINSVQRISDLESALHAGAQHAENLTAIRTALESERDAYKYSLSWRITQPLRQAGHTGRRLRQAWQNSRAAARKLGGWIALIRKVVDVLRSSGLSGLRYRVQNLHPASLPAADSTESDYERWVKQYDTIDDTTRATMLAKLATWSTPPLISVLMPTYNTPEIWLRKAIDALLAQIYPHWQLCIADDASSDPAVRRILEEYCARDSRIRVVYREQNGHISAASNDALTLCRGAFTALYDHDDELPAHALYCVAKCILAKPDVAIIYSDEDKIDTVGRRFGAYFKSDFNYDLFLSQNMISHLGVYRTELMREVGGFREGFEGSQDYDLALRVLEKCGPDKVLHIPRVLYHWRVIPGSTAADGNAKPYAFIAAQRAVQDHLQRQQIPATISEAVPGSHMMRVKYESPNPPPRVTLIIPTRDGGQVLARCIERIINLTRYTNYHILIIDNGSQDPTTVAMLASWSEHPNINVYRDPRPFNYSALNNAAVAQTQSEFICLLNDDTEVISPDWLDELMSHGVRPNVGIVGCKLLYPDGKLQHGGVVLGLGGVAGHAHHQLDPNQVGYFCRAALQQHFSAVTAACALMRKSVFESVGGLDEINLAVAFNDVDLCLRVRALGLNIVWTPFAMLYHHESISRGNDLAPDKIERFKREVAHMRSTWGKQLDADPAYNPNLSLAHPDFSLAWPPRLGADFAVP